MKMWSRGKRWLVLVLAVPVGVFCQPGVSYGQSDPFHKSIMNFNETKTEYGVGDGVHVDEKPIPYKGQIYCPVTGVKLGLKETAIEVQTAIGEQKPSSFRKMMGAKTTPGVVMYVCCPECAKKVKTNPSAYLLEVIADKAVFSFSYDAAPNQRPERPKEKSRETVATPPLPPDSVALPPPGGPVHDVPAPSPLSGETRLSPGF